MADDEKFHEYFLFGENISVISKGNSGNAPNLLWNERSKRKNAGLTDIFLISFPLESDYSEIIICQNFKISRDFIKKIIRLALKYF